MAENRDQSAAARVTEGLLGAVGAAGRRARDAGAVALAAAGRRTLGVATLLAVAGALMLAYSETLDVYRIVTPDGATSSAPGAIQQGGDQHTWALAVIGAAIAVAAVLARATRQRLPAWAAVLLAVIALAIVLIGDLPDATRSGLTTERESGDAEPQSGFWTALAGAVVALGGAGLLATRLSRGAGRREAAT